MVTCSQLFYGSIECDVPYLVSGSEQIQNQLLQKPYEGAETDFQAKFAKETIAGIHRGVRISQ
jgi:hypothetical protein